MRELDTSRTILSPLFKERIQAMHQTKLEVNQVKLAKFGGSYNTDDHGFIPLETSYVPSGEVLFGARRLGFAMKEFFACLPPYIHPQSALAGCWIG